MLHDLPQRVFGVNVDDFLNRLHTVSACLVRSYRNAFGRDLPHALSNTDGAHVQRGLLAEKVPRETCPLRYC